jgi:hypothetical protein
VAARNRGNHSRGADTVRPSFNTTVSASSEHAASTATASPTSTEVGIPFLQEQLPILFHEVANCRQLVAPKPAIRGQRDRFEPELGVPSSLCDVNVSRLAVLETVKEEPIIADAQQRWRDMSLPSQRSRPCISARKSFNAI